MKDKITDDFIINNISAGILVINKNHQLVKYNNYASKLFNIKKSNLHKNFEKIFDKNPEIKEKIIKNLKLNKKNFKMPVCKILKKNAEVLIEAKRYNDNIMLQVYNISELASIEKMKTIFVDLISHQLLTPLSSMKYFCEMLESEELGKLNVKQKGYIDDIGDGTKRMISLIKEFVKVSKFESGNSVIKIKKINIQELINEIIESNENILRAKNFNIVVNIEAKEHKYVYADISLLKQALLIIIDNSIKYCSSGKCEISINLTKKEKNIIIAIQDNGVGIPKNEQHGIFNRFYRCKGAYKNNVNGNGLGLYLAKIIIETMDGQIWFKSVQNKGTTFYISIPYKN